MSDYGSNIRIARTLTLPKTFVTDVDFLSGIRGSGKSYCAGVIEEKMLKANWPFIIIDPLGIHYAVREKYDNVVIIGGEHSDVENIGRAIDQCLLNGVNFVFDLSGYDIDRQQVLCAIVCECSKEYKPGPLKVFIEECDIFIPQRGGLKRCKDAIKWLVRKERMNGIGMTLICQRFASVDKEVVTQVENYFIFKTFFSADIKGIKEIIRLKNIDMIMDSKAGHCWLQSPYGNQEVVISKRMCKHLGNTPVLGEEDDGIEIMELDSEIRELLFEKEEIGFLDRLRSVF